jgi:diguanylate cyclase (GGDEF)-like protein
MVGEDEKLQLRDSDLFEAQRILKLPNDEATQLIANLISKNRITDDKIIDLEGDVSRLQLDGLTGLYNRDGLNIAFSDRVAILERNIKEIRQTGALKQPEILGFRGYSVLWVDMVGLKKFNDEKGVKEGDKRLKKLADVMTAAVKRPLDLKARIGGDDFVVVLINTTEEGSSFVVSRMQELLSETDINVSIGIADFGPQTKLSDALYLASDAMEEAKKLGKMDENFRSLGVGVFTFHTGSDPIQI